MAGPARPREVIDGVNHTWCNRCKTMVPDSNFYVRKDKELLFPECIPCKKEYERNRRAELRSRDPEYGRRLVVDEHGNRMASCCDCREMKPVEEFKVSESGIVSWRCLKCKADLKEMYAERSVRRMGRLITGAPATVGDDELEEISRRFHEENGLPYDGEREVEYNSRYSSVHVGGELAAEFRDGEFHVVKFCGNGFVETPREAHHSTDDVYVRECLRDEEGTVRLIREAYRKFCKSRGIPFGNDAIRNAKRRVCNFQKNRS